MSLERVRAGKGGSWRISIVLQGTCLKEAITISLVNEKLIPSGSDGETSLPMGVGETVRQS